MLYAGTSQQQAQDALQDAGSQTRPFEAVMVYTDPHDWYKDLQLIHDVVTSGAATASLAERELIMTPKRALFAPAVI